MMAADFLLAKTQRRKQERLVTATGPRRTSTVTSHNSAPCSGSSVADDPAGPPHPHYINLFIYKLVTK